MPSDIARHVLLWLPVLLLCLPTAGYCQRIMIDVGHSPQSSGAVACSGRQEYLYNKDLAEPLATRLRKEAHTVSLTPEADLAAHAAAADQYDLLLSLHHDSVQPQFGSKNRHTGGFCTAKAAGFSIFVSGLNLEYERSLSIARQLGKALVARGAQPTLHHAEAIPGENRPLLEPELGIYRYDGLRLLKQAKVPAVLLEVAVITNPEDEKRAASPEYRRLVLDAITETMAKMP